MSLGLIILIVIYLLAWGGWGYLGTGRGPYWTGGGGLILGLITLLVIMAFTGKVNL
jgi:hypothetical protein